MLPLPPAHPVRRRPEVLAPAGDLASLRAALAAGADAVYFGLDAGFNARARAANFSSANLAETVALVHRAGARVYLALNTLVFERELGLVEDILRRVAAAGTDAIIVQDPAVALLAAAVCPTLEVHASTQMTVSSAEGAAFAAGLGVRRVVLPRELSVAEIRRLAAATDLELEVFIHGALCVSWSGQCLTSEAWGGRSANRGQCAQSCRLPYDLVVDGAERELGDVRYLLSPKDLAGVRAVEALLDIGVHGLKIEGRQKGPQYVATAVTGYRRWVDALASRETPPTDAPMTDAVALTHDLNDMALSYTRGFGDGFLAGSDHQTLVEGRFPKHRGLYLGRVREVRGAQVLVGREARPGSLGGGFGRGGAGAPQAPVGTVSSPLVGLGGSDEAASGPGLAPVAIRPGMGVVFDAGQPETEEVGGPVFQVEEDGDDVVLGFGRHSQSLKGTGGQGAQGPDLRRVKPGQRVWVTSDPVLARQTERLVEGPEPEGRIALGLAVSGAAGQPLQVRARVLAVLSQGSAYAARAAGNPEVMVESEALLAPAAGTGLDPALLGAKLAALGGTPFRVVRRSREFDPQANAAGDTTTAAAETSEAIDTSALEPGLHLPVSELKRMRRRIVEQLLPVIERGPVHEVTNGPQLERLREAARAGEAQRTAARPDLPRRPPTLVPLCRTSGQLEAVIAAGRIAFPEVELDWMEMVGLGRAVERARAAGLRITIATPRVQKPGEEGYDARIARLEPDGVLVRHWGAVMHFASPSSLLTRPSLHGDFSLNVTNSLTAHHLLALGLDSLTAAHDLDAAQLFDLLAAAPARRFTVVVHHHVPTFHTEHCVYSHLLSQGRDYHSCGRPCEQHEVALRDREGLVHPVVVDVGCRNTVFNARAQSAASLVPRLIERGVARLRIEFVRESEAEAVRVLEAYLELVAGCIAPTELVRRVGVHEQFGVTRGTMRVLG